MKNCFDQFKYQLVKSTEEGYKEVLVTYNYKGRTCHYYSFIKEKVGSKISYYINEAKEDVNRKINNGKLEKRAKHYLSYKVDNGVVEVPTKGATGVTQVKKKRPYIKYLCLAILGILFLAGAVFAYLYRADILKWWQPSLTDQEKYIAMVCLYSSIAGLVAGLACLGVGIPLFIIKLKKRK